MKQRITRKQMKRNDLAETVGRTVDYVSGHRKGVVEAIAIAAGAALIVSGIFLFRLYRENEAGKELSAGLAALEAPLVGQPAAATAAKTYATEQDREREARLHLQKAAARSGTAPGRAAAVILAVRDPSERSGEVLARAAREGKAEVAAAAELDAARLLAARGKTTEAIDRLKRAIESPGSAAPKDALLFALAETYEKSGSPADARATYQRLVNDYPNSPYRAEARQRSGAEQ